MTKYKIAYCCNNYISITNCRYYEIIRITSILCYHVVFYSESLAYTPIDVVAGETVELPCNASRTSDFMWTYGTGDGYVDYVYWKGRFPTADRMSTKSTTETFHSLEISNVRQTDSGLYDCYLGKRKVGYQLNVTGKTV